MEPETTVFGSLLGLAAERAQDTYGTFRNREGSNDRVDELSASFSDTIEIAGEPLVAMGTEKLVTVGYQLVLGREHQAIDEPGWNYWVGELDEGNVTAENFLAALARGAFNDDFDGELAELNDQDEAHLHERAAVVPDPPRGGADGIAQDLANAGVASPPLESVVTALPPFIRAELAIEFTGIEPGEPVAGELFDVTVTVEETAGIETDGLSVNLVIVGPEIDETITANGALSELSGETATVTFDELVIGEADDYIAVVTANADNADRVSDNKEFTVQEDMGTPIGLIGQSDMADSIEAFNE